ncbi:hypothetical protein KBK19_07530 [Microvirga sp. STR05]|uniref:Uncharacterized protein n=1 Tax=Hymenobacter duratus TaxID=2771356 RepID=A0ABR8JHL0_9BACT|nr:hypothetical protein [Hymenobacter duratus]MBD2714880.1 hypothetical protein [Hymenobacter duratus]MBR7949786.1 hypothetical protein [Microvirga sp. STR05]
MSRRLLRSLTIFALLLPAAWSQGQSRRKPAAPVVKRFQPTWLTIGEEAGYGAGSGFSARLYRTGHASYCNGAGDVYTFVLPDTTNRRLWQRIDKLSDAQFRFYAPEYPIDAGSYFLLRDQGVKRPLRASYILESQAPAIAPLFKHLQQQLRPPAGSLRPPLVRTPQTTVPELFPCSF